MEKKMNKYKGLIECLCCNRHKFKGRKERNNIIYRCNYRLKYGKDKCDNDNSIDEKFIDNMISQQLFVINMNIENIDVISIIDRIEVSKTRIEIFFKNLPITSCYIDSKNGKLHYDTLNS